MTDRLLTDEEQEAICNRHHHGYDGHDGYSIAEEVARAQDANTLKAVGEWLGGVCKDQPVVRAACPTCVTLLGFTLKQGKMPE